MNKLNVVIVGAGGRMGKMLLEIVLNDRSAELIAAIDQVGSPAFGSTVGELVGMPCDIRISADLDRALKDADCLIDFTRPQGALLHLEACVRHKVAMVIGTTGFENDEKEQVVRASEEIPIVFSPNMSVGVNVVFKLLELATSRLNEGYDIEIVEAHHRLKADAPSGTALRMGEVIAETLGRDLMENAVFGREGMTGERADSTIGFSTIRGGDIVGDHTVMYCGIGERIEISHKSASRMPYARGAVRAAHFLADKQKGLFDMQDVLGLHEAR